MSKDNLAEEAVKKVKDDLRELMESMLDSSCMGCMLVALSEASLNLNWEVREKEIGMAEEIREFARNYSGRVEYCGTCRSDLWDIPRNEADALSEPWKTHKPKRLIGLWSWRGK